MLLGMTSMQNVQINETQVATVYGDSSVPGSNEVAIASTGVMTFNAADAGKSVNVLAYAYVKN
jgi:hypothetical protein